MLDYTQLTKCIQQTLEENSLQSIPFFITKCLQLHDTLTSRHGVMLVGDSCSGKTTCYRVLAKALSKLGSKESKTIETIVINQQSLFQLIRCVFQCANVF